MKNWLLVPLTIALLGILLLSGCTSFVAPEELAKVQGELAKVQGELTIAQEKVESLEVQVATLATLSAYNVWHDQFYAKGAYSFADIKSFNEKLGSLIQATGDNASETSWNAYITADKSLSDVIVALPEDTSTWTQEQYGQWYEAGTNRYTTLGGVGTALFNCIAQ